MTETKPRLVARRRVVHIAGFEAVLPHSLDRRMKSGLNRFAALWGAKTTVAEPTLAEDGRVMTWEVDARGPNWTTRCTYNVLRWDDLMMPYFHQPWSSKMIRGYRALFEFARTGTIARYFKANVRYGLFVLYPILLLVGFAIVGVLAGIAVAAIGAPLPWITGTIVGALCFLLLLRYLGRYFHLDFALADWAFAADLARREVPGLEDYLARFRDVVIANVRDPDVDEVLLSSVSLGAVMLTETIARAYSTAPDLGAAMDKVAFLTVGSSILKIGLHPSAEDFRKDVGRIGSEPTLFWAEYQAKVDPINFYKTDPVADLGMPATGRPIVEQVRIRDMMSAEGYREAQWSSLLLHRQFVMPNAKRYFYDFYQMAFGPMDLRRRVALGRDAADAFADDGSYIATEPKPRMRRTRTADQR